MSRWLSENIANIELQHIPQFGGEVYYVSTSKGSDSNDGKSPETAFVTIGKAITEMSDGDAINIMAGTYTETGLDLSNDFAEMWCEIGTLIDPASGTALTVSGASCKISGRLKITPDDSAIGLLVSGAECGIDDVKVVEGSHNFSITGSGVVLNRCAAGFPKTGTAGFNLAGAQARLRMCTTIGDTTSYGYWINGTVDTGLLTDCTSVGHQTSGYTIATGSKDWTILDCSSGAGDGKWTDADNNSTWSNFSYDNEKYKRIDFDGNAGDIYQAAAADGTHYNLFKITGAVNIHNISAHVEEVMPAIASVVNLELESDNNSIDITDAAGAPDLNGLVVGTILERRSDATDPLEIGEPDSVCAVIENTNFRDPKIPITLVEDDSSHTYIQMVCAAAMNGGGTGKIHWHIEWEPVTCSGFVSPA